MPRKRTKNRKIQEPKKEDKKYKEDKIRSKERK